MNCLPPALASAYDQFMAGRPAIKQDQADP
jgi:hypothetical protein